MTAKPKCLIWGTELTDYKNNIAPIEKQKHLFDSPRAGGKYRVDYLTWFDPHKTFNLDSEEKIRLSGYIAKENLKGNSPPAINVSNNWLEKLPPIPSIRERAFLLLEVLVKKTSVIGTEFLYKDFLFDDRYSFNNPYCFFYPLTYSSQTREIKFLLNYLKDLSFIEISNKEPNQPDTLQVTVKGFEKINELSKSSNSKTAFIAMWFDNSMDQVKEGIETAVKKTGYSPLRIDDKPHNNKIDDEILNEIRKSKFVICDLTSEKEKPRGSVYFEAGYAMGKDIPIIWTCRKDLVKELPFDIRQYNCLYWETNNMDDFIKKLKNRIENTVGKGQ